MCVKINFVHFDARLEVVSKDGKGIYKELDKLVLHLISKIRDTNDMLMNA